MKLTLCTKSKPKTEVYGLATDAVSDPVQGQDKRPLTMLKECNCKHPKNIMIYTFSVLFLVEFCTFLGSWGLPGASWSLLGPPLETPSQIWTTKEGPRVAPRASWGGLWVDLGVLLGALNTSLGKIFDTFLEHVFQEGSKPVLDRILHDFWLTFLLLFWTTLMIEAQVKNIVFLLLLTTL